MDLFKNSVNTRKYFRIVSNLLDILEDAESYRLNMQKIVLDLDFAKVSPKTERFTFFISMIQREIQWWHSKLPAQKAKYSDQCTYDNIDSFMNIVIDMHNFRIYDTKEYIRTSFPGIFCLIYDHSYLSRYTLAYHVLTQKVISTVQLPITRTKYTTLKRLSGVTMNISKSVFRIG